MDDQQQQQELESDKNPPTTTIEDDDTCIICFQPFATQGPHRLVCLKCGHLFGRECIRRWLDQSNRCPHCNRSAQVRDIRRVFARRIVQVDTAEVEMLKAKLRSESSTRRELEMKIAAFKIEVCSMQRQLMLYQQQSHGVSSTAAAADMVVDKNAKVRWVKVRLEKTKRMAHSTGGRVLIFNRALNAFIFSRKSDSPIVPGFGVGMLDVGSSSWACSELPRPPVLHSSAIKDMCCHVETNPALILTAGMDSHAKAYDLRSGQCEMDLELTRPVWSCAFGSTNGSSAYLGLANGIVSEYDLRMLNSKIGDIYEAEFSQTPVNALTPILPYNESHRKGLLICQLDTTTFVDFSSSASERVFRGYMPISSSCDPASKQILLTFRPGRSQPHQIHNVSKLSETQSQEVLSNITQFQGSLPSTILSRSTIFSLNDKSNQAANCLVASFSSMEKSIIVYDVAREGQIVAKIKGPTNVTDLCATHTAGHSELVASISPDSVDVFALEY